MHVERNFRHADGQNASIGSGGDTVSIVLHCHPCRNPATAQDGPYIILYSCSRQHGPIFFCSFFDSLLVPVGVDTVSLFLHCCPCRNPATAQDGPYIIYIIFLFQARNYPGEAQGQLGEGSDVF